MVVSDTLVASIVFLLVYRQFPHGFGRLGLSYVREQGTRIMWEEGTCVVPPFLVRVVIERHAPRRSYRTSSHHERSRQTGDWRRGGDPPPSPTSSFPLLSSPPPHHSPVPRNSPTSPHPNHANLTLRFTHTPLSLSFSFPIARRHTLSLSLSRPLSATFSPLSPRTLAPLPIPSSRLCLSLMPRPAMTRTALTPQRSSSNASTLSPSPLVFLSGLSIPVSLPFPDTSSYLPLPLSLSLHLPLSLGSANCPSSFSTVPAPSPVRLDPPRPAAAVAERRR